LQRRDGVETLPDRHVIGVADGPLLAELADLPLRIRDDAGRFARKVDPGRSAEPEHARVFRDLVRAHALLSGVRIAAAEGVEVDVARVRVPGDEVDGAVRPPV